MIGGTQSKALITLKRIVFLWSEGRTSHTGQATTWHQASGMLRGWALTAPKDGGYDKTGFRIEWSDGDTYEGRYDLQRRDFYAHRNLLLAHVKENVLYHAGLLRPYHVDPEQYAGYLRWQDNYASAHPDEMASTADFKAYYLSHYWDDLNPDVDYWWACDDNFYPFEWEEVQVDRA